MKKKITKYKEILGSWYKLYEVIDDVDDEKVIADLLRAKTKNEIYKIEDVKETKCENV